MKITLLKKGKEAKDRMVGWNTYRVIFICRVCGQKFIEIITGTFEEVQQAYADAICSDCELKESNNG